jgi:hypothetical protein
MIYLHAKFYTSYSKGSLVIAIKPKDEEKLLMASLIFCVLKQMVRTFSTIHHFRNQNHVASASLPSSQGLALKGAKLLPNVRL